MGVTCVLGRQKNKSVFFSVCGCTVSYFYTSTFKDLQSGKDASRQLGTWRSQKRKSGPYWIQTFNLEFLKSPISRGDEGGEERCWSGHSRCPEAKMNSLIQQRVQPCEETLGRCARLLASTAEMSLAALGWLSVHTALRNGWDIQYCGSRHDKMDIFPQRVELLHVVRQIFPQKVTGHQRMSAVELGFKNAQRQQTRHKHSISHQTNRTQGFRNVSRIHQSSTGEDDIIRSSEPTNKVQPQITESVHDSSITAEWQQYDSSITAV